MPQTPARQTATLFSDVSSTECVPWQQVQGFLDMAESALRAKNAANNILLQEQADAVQSLAHQNHQDTESDQAEDTAFLRQQLEALLRERAASKEMIAGLEREKGFLLDERQLLFQELQSLDLPSDITAAEPARPDAQRVYRRAMTVGRWSHRNLEDNVQAREELAASQAKGRRLFAMEPATPPDCSQDARSSAAQAMAREQEEAGTPLAENDSSGQGSEPSGPDTQEQFSNLSGQTDVWARSPLRVRTDAGQNAVHVFLASLNTLRP